PAGIGSKSAVGSTWLASNPCKSATGLFSFRDRDVGQGRHERRPRQGQFAGKPVTVLGDAPGAADGAQDAVAALPPEGVAWGRVHAGRAPANSSGDLLGLARIAHQASDHAEAILREGPGAAF